MGTQTQAIFNAVVNHFTPFAELYRSASQVLTDTPVSIDYTSATSHLLTANTTNNDITVLTPGYYELTFTCNHVKGAAEREVELTILKNGSLMLAFNVSKELDKLVKLDYKKVYLLAANDVMSTQIRYDDGSGSGTDMSITGATLLVKKLT